MTKISAADVKKLRDATGAGMMDCKKALVEAEGNFDKAIEVLRKKGQKVAAKRADRESTEGAAIAKVNDSKTVGVSIVLGCEPDFVGKNEGEFLVVEPGKRVVYTWEWNGDGEVTTIEVRFAALDSGSRVIQQ